MKNTCIVNKSKKKRKQLHNKDICQYLYISNTLNMGDSSEKKKKNEREKNIGR